MFGFIKAYFEKRRAEKFQRLRACAEKYLKDIYTSTPKPVAQPKPKKVEPPVKKEHSEEDRQQPKESSDVRFSFISGNTRYSISTGYSRDADYFNRARLDTWVTDNLALAKKSRSFVEELLFNIRTTGLTAPIVYQRANIDKRHYSKLISGHVSPSREVSIALAIALQLNYEQAQDFIGKAGYTLSTNSERDVLIRFCLQQGICHVYEVNLLLDSFNQKLL